jgi:hypothetical protein
MRLLKVLFGFFYMVGSWYGTSAYSQSSPERIIPFIVNNDHIIIKLSIEDSPPLNFLFDSGAGGTLLSQGIADSLELKPSLYRKNVGVSGVHKVGVIKGKKATVGEAEFNITFLCTDTPLEELDNGEIVHGVIGYPILSRYVVKIDYTANQLKLYNRNSFKYEGKGQKLAIDIKLNMPIAKASVIMYNGVAFEGDFLIDTGARSDVIISSPTVVKYDMPENIGKYYTVRAKIGSSQRKSKIRHGRLQSLGIAKYNFENIPVALSSDNIGVLAIPSLNGIIGNRTLKRFNIIFDYHRGVLYLEPSVLIGDDYFINSSGFNVYFKGGKPFVKDIIDRSPADKAGLKADDEIISINGRLIEIMATNEIRESFIGLSGKLEIVIMRNRKFKYTEFYLKPLI